MIYHLLYQATILLKKGSQKREGEEKRGRETEEIKQKREINKPLNFKLAKGGIAFFSGFLGLNKLVNF